VDPVLNYAVTGWYMHPKGENSMAVSRLVVESPTLSANGPRK